MHEAHGIMIKIVHGPHSLPLRFFTIGFFWSFCRAASSLCETSLSHPDDVSWYVSGARTALARPPRARVPALFLSRGLVSDSSLFLTERDRDAPLLVPRVATALLSELLDSSSYLVSRDRDARFLAPRVATALLLEPPDSSTFLAGRDRDAPLIVRRVVTALLLEPLGMSSFLAERDRVARLLTPRMATALLSESLDRTDASSSLSEEGSRSFPSSLGSDSFSLCDFRKEESSRSLDTLDVVCIRVRGEASSPSVSE